MSHVAYLSVIILLMLMILSLLKLQSLESSPQTMIDGSPVAGNLNLARSLYLRAESNAEVVKSEPSIPSELKTKVCFLRFIICFTANQWDIFNPLFIYVFIMIIDVIRIPRFFWTYFCI